MVAEHHRTTEELAEERTHRAEQRTLLALERTFNAWIRTGLAAVAAGIGIGRLFAGSPNYGRVARAIGILLVLAGAVLHLVGLWRYRIGSRRLEDAGLPVTPFWLVYLVVGALVIIVILGLIVLG